MIINADNISGSEIFSDNTMTLQRLLFNLVFLPAHTQNTAIKYILHDHSQIKNRATVLKPLGIVHENQIPNQTTAPADDKILRQ
jgi:hypothetical protein